MAVFLTVVLAVWAAMHLYVFWRLGSVPWVAAHCSARALVCIAVALWLSYPLARMFESRGWDGIGLPLEFFAANWIGVLFLLVAAMLLTDLLTLGGRLFADRAPAIRGGAALVALAASALALIQGLRAPAVTEHEVALPGLPATREGTRIAVLSDLHLGTLLGRRWLEDRIEQVRRLNPDLILLVGDVVDGNNRRITPVVPTLARFRAPLGVFAVTGNHEFYAGVEASVACLESAGIKVLRDSAVEVAPGLVIAGVDDLTARQQFQIPGDGLLKALQNRPVGAPF
jgi:hypothetical protein